MKASLLHGSARGCCEPSNSPATRGRGGVKLAASQKGQCPFITPPCNPAVTEEKGRHTTTSMLKCKRVSQSHTGTDSYVRQLVERRIRAQGYDRTSWALLVPTRWLRVRNMPGKENDTKRHYRKITFVGDSLEGTSLVASRHGMGNSLKGAGRNSGESERPTPRSRWLFHVYAWFLFLFF